MALSNFYSSIGNAKGAKELFDETKCQIAFNFQNLHPEIHAKHRCTSHLFSWTTIAGGWNLPSYVHSESQPRFKSVVLRRKPTLITAIANDESMIVFAVRRPTFLGGEP